MGIEGRKERLLTVCTCKSVFLTAFKFSAVH